MAEASDLRVSDADRERVAALLGAHYAAGRLDEGEFDQRLNSVYAARTESDLVALQHDLPALPATEIEARAELVERRRHLQRRMLQQAGGGLAPFVICTFVWAASGAHASFWPIWTLFALVPLLRSGWHMYGPAPDLDRVEAELEQRARKRERHAERHMRRVERRYDRRA